jgi:hypothetical protein
MDDDDSDDYPPEYLHPAMVEKMLAMLEEYVLAHEKFEGYVPYDGPPGAFYS